MNYFLSRLQSEVATQVQKILDVSAVPVVQLKNVKAGSDVAVPCFAFAKEKGQSPDQLARKVAQELAHPAVQRIEATGGFVNLWLKAEVIVQTFVDDLLHAADTAIVYGQYADGHGQTVIAEFPSPNVAKPFGVGHMRSANQGWATYKLMKAMGYDVIRDSHLGDWGTPFGKWATGFKRFSSEEKLAKGGVYELVRVYIKMTAEMKFEAEHDKHELADEVQQWLVKLEQGDEEAKALSQRFLVLSLEHIHGIQDRLKIELDEELGESFYIPEAKKMIQELLEKGIAQENPDGTVIVPLEEYGIKTPVLLRKSNGAALYATTDLATVKYRWERWHPAKVLYFVGNEQQFHFKQIFALADKVGYGQPEYQHIQHGMIDQLDDDGTRSKMSSRKGAVLLEDLFDKAEAKARELVKATGSEGVSDDDIKKIAMGAIKFTDFAADRRTGILFDWDRMFSVQGYSGPYVQYAGVRINAILRKLGQVSDIPFDGTYDWEAEKALLLHLHTYPLVIREAAAAYEPHKIAQFAYELARLLNRYYEETPVAQSEANIQRKRLWFLGHIQRIHQNALSILGIEVPERM